VLQVLTQSLLCNLPYPVSGRTLSTNSFIATTPFARGSLRICVFAQDRSARLGAMMSSPLRVLTPLRPRWPIMPQKVRTL
jgi:hypothetical protein